MTTSKSKAKPKPSKGKGDVKQMKNFFTVVGIIAVILFFLIYMIFQST